MLAAPDADVAVHVRIGRGEVRLGDGDVEDAHVRIQAVSDRLLSLATIPTRLGLPDLARPEGREMVRDLLAGRLRIRGLVRHPVRLARLTRLLSVAERGAAG